MEELNFQLMNLLKVNLKYEEYLDFYEGPGAQHIAVATDDIISTVREIKI